MRLRLHDRLKLRDRGGPDLLGLAQHPCQFAMQLNWLPLPGNLFVAVTANPWVPRLCRGGSKSLTFTTVVHHEAFDVCHKRSVVSDVLLAKDFDDEQRGDDPNAICSLPSGSSCL